VRIERPTAVVWLAGNNDVMQHRGWRRPLQAVLNRTASVPCVVLVGLTEVGGYVFDNDVARRYNAELARLAAADPRIRVVRWNDVLKRFVRLGVALTDDTLHPNVLGRRLLAAAILDAVQTCPPTPRPARP
jgi:lysophospholipase L1-like esterase